MFNQSSFGSGFGQSNAFGANNNTMSGSSLFGANSNGLNQGQQQSTFGAPATGAQSTGLFGQANQNQQPAAATGFGGFGQPAQPQQTNAFGQPAASQGSSLFGAKPSPFGGASTTAPGTNTTAAFGGATTGANGTAVVPFQARQEPEQSRPSHTNIYQSITAMPQYSNFSFEELRLQDYQQNRRYGDGGNAFGAQPTPSTPFNAGNTSTGFGFGGTQQNAFGQPAASNSSPFGQSNTGTSLFGQPQQPAGQTSSPFGTQPKPAFGFGAQPAANNTTSMFGSNTAANSSPFGSNTGTTTSNTFGSFGQPQQQQQTSFGFGAQNNTNTGGTGIFGQNNANTSSGSLFGQPQQNANTSGNLFGQKPATSLFGQTNTSTQPNTGTGFTFGQTSQPAQTNSTGIFGANNTNNTGGFGQKPAGTFGTTSTFGQTNTGSGFSFGQNQAAQQPASGGLFGANSATNTTPAFGQTQQNTNTGSLFGQNNNTTSGGLFGQSNTQANTFGQAKPATTGGLFGNTANTGTSLFGNNANTSGTTNTGTGLFGSQNNQPAQAGTFGQAKPATGGLFGQTTQPAATSGTTSLFGQQQQPATTGFGQPAAGATSTTTGGLFGNKPAGQTTSLFGNTTQPANSTTGTAGATTGFGSTFGKPAGTSLFGGSTFGQQAQQPAQQTGLGGSLFGQPAAAGTAAPAGTTSLFGQPQQPQQAQPQPGQPLVASINQNPFGNNPLFANVPAAGSKPEQFATPLTPSAPPKRLDPLIAFHVRPRRRATAEAGPQKALPAPKAEAKPAVPEKPENEALYSESTDKLILRAELFAPRSSALRRLVLDPRGEEPEVGSVSLPDSSAVELQPAASSTPPRIKIGDLSVSVPSSSASASATSAPKAELLPDNEQIDENGYWISPSQSKLDEMSVKELEAVKHFRVGRKDIGFVEFDAPVDLSSYSNVRKQIAGHLIVFADRMFSLYPEDQACPPPGQGFNVGATVTLYNLLVKAKDTNQPIRDANNGLCKRQLRRLQAFPNTTFVSWDPATGTWVFKLSARETAK